MTAYLPEAVSDLRGCGIVADALLVESSAHDRQIVEVMLQPRFDAVPSAVVDILARHDLRLADVSAKAGSVYVAAY